MKQFGGAGVLLEDAHVTDGGGCDELKLESAIDGMRTQNFHQHHATTREITLVEGDAGGRRIGWPIALRFLFDEMRDAVAILPRGELLGEACGRLRRAVGISDE